MFIRRIAVIGSGYVGLTTGACLASLGHRVVCADVDPGKVARLSAGKVSILEPGLPELVGGGADLSAVEAVAAEVRSLLPTGCVVVNKSTVPVGTAARTAQLLDRPDVAVVSNPEFLREGSAVHDFLNPDRIVVGCDAQDAAERVAALYARLGAPTVLTDAASAEMVKYAANCFLAMKLSYVNAIAELCERSGADVLDVTEGIGYDRRIGQAFLQAGPGWGGSCLPKDTHALLQVCAAADFDFPLLRASLDTNTRQQHRMVDKVRDAVGGSLAGQRVGLLGLTFKAGTDDLRDSPALTVAALLAAEGADLIGYDPGVPAAVSGMTDDLQVTDDPLKVASGAAVLVVLTEWPEFRLLDWGRLAELVERRIVVDTRNLLDADVLRRVGFEVCGIGRRPSRALTPS